MSSEEDIIADNLPESPRKDNALFKPKSQPKVIRVLTVLAYILSVSMAAILLSTYYIFMWHGRPQPGAQKMINFNITNHFEIPAVRNSTTTEPSNPNSSFTEKEDQRQQADEIGTTPPALTIDEPMTTRNDNDFFQR